MLKLDSKWPESIPYPWQCSQEKPSIQPASHYVGTSISTFDSHIIPILLSSIQDIPLTGLGILFWINKNFLSVLANEGERETMEGSEQRGRNLKSNCYNRINNDYNQKEKFQNNNNQAKLFFDPYWKIQIQISLLIILF